MAEKGGAGVRVLTILGTRPEIIRLSLIIQKLDRWAEKHVLVHTGQNYDRLLSDIFFEQMNVRQPDYRVTITSHSFGVQIGNMFPAVESVLAHEKPDAVLVLGDTNSALCTLLAERAGIPVYHMEAGNRCHDLTVPEEINRKLIDSVASFNLPYTEGSRENLLREGIPSHRIWVSGNPIYEVLQHYREAIEASTILQDLRLVDGRYLLVTAHRAENVDNRHRLLQTMEALHRLAEWYRMPIICSVHPRTRERLKQFGIQVKDPLVRLMQPFGFFDFVHLEQHAMCVITDSGTVQEECCIFGVPAVTIRQSTERPETVMCGSNVVSGLESGRIVDSVRLMVDQRHDWPRPEGYLDPHVSNKVAQFILGGCTHV
jgi:UDP-N-acetylglucosamine 2-epimerase (non-hydrolysing)